MKKIETTLVAILSAILLVSCGKFGVEDCCTDKCCTEMGDFSSPTTYHNPCCGIYQYPDYPNCENHNPDNL